MNPDADGPRSKQLTPENWNQPDPVMGFMGSLIQGRIVPMTPQHQADALLIPELALPETVPLDVRELYESAQAVAVYGGFYHPLNAVGVHLLGRALEAAAHEALERQGENAKTFARAIDRLNALGVLTPARRAAWHRMRRFRNAGAHARDQEQYTLGMVTEYFQDARAAIVHLFPS